MASDAKVEDSGQLYEHGEERKREARKGQCASLKVMQ